MHRKFITRFRGDGSQPITVPQRLNQWIGGAFAIGSVCFAFASLLLLFPSLAGSFAKELNIGGIYFLGSIPFTFAAGLQLFQAANADAAMAPSNRRRVLFGWRPHEIGWLSCALQFGGTILFNFNTFDAMLKSLDWLQQDVVVWAPDFFGSILFLASGYLAFVEVCHAHWAFRPTSWAWWLNFINLLGCISFMISACFAFVPPGLPNQTVVMLATLFTLLGAVCFFIGALMTLQESPESS